MSKGFILNNDLNSDDQKRIRENLQRQGVEPIWQPFDIYVIDPSDDIAVVCLPATPDDGLDLDGHVEKCIKRGIRIVVIWLSDEGKLPSVLGKYGAASAAVDSPELVEILSGAATWTEPSGKIAPKETIPRNKC